jgi:cell division protein FtsQ
MRRAGRLGLLAAKAALVGAVLLGAGMGGYLSYQRLMTSDTFRIQAIRVEGARNAPAEELQRLAQDLLGRHIFNADVAAARAAVMEHPWVRSASLHRRLPDTVVVEVQEHEPRALLLIGHLYLVNPEGQVFKRAAVGETAGLPVITGLARLDYLNNPQAAGERIRRALAALERYGQGRGRPPLSEINVSPRGTVTLFLQRGGVALHFGNGVSEDRLQKLDAVWAALGPETGRARAVFLDNEAHRSRVTVRMGSY